MSRDKTENDVYNNFNNGNTIKNELFVFVKIPYNKNVIFVIERKTKGTVFQKMQ